MSRTAVGGPLDATAAPEPTEFEANGVMLVRLRYPAVSRAPTATSYRVEVAPLRLRAIMHRADAGFIGEVPELAVLGYGEDPRAALDDLRDAVRDYLAIVKDDERGLAPPVAHHAAYLPLLDVPEESWFAAVEMTVRPGDAPDVE